jgi:hypothetical protein
MDAYDPATFAVLVIEMDAGVDCGTDGGETEDDAEVLHIE